MSDISRVTQNSAAMLMVSDMESDLSGLTLLQEQAASGKALNQPSDNPTGTSEVLSMNSQIGRFQQYATNAGDGLVPAANGFAAHSNSVTEALNQVQTDVLSGANASASDSSDRAALSADVLSIKQEILGYAGTTYNDKPVFSGTYGTTPYPQGSASGISDPTSASYDPATAYAYAGSATALSRVVAPGAVGKCQRDRQPGFRFRDLERVRPFGHDLPGPCERQHLGAQRRRPDATAFCDEHRDPGGRRYRVAQRCNNSGPDQRERHGVKSPDPGGQYHRCQ